MYKRQDPEIILMGLEPILIGGDIRGYTTSAAYGYSAGRSVAIGYISLDGENAENVVTLGGFEIEAALTRHKATASLKPIYDPDGERLRM